MDGKQSIGAQIAQQNAELDGLEALIREQMTASISSGSDLQGILDTKLAMVSAMRQGLAAGIPLSSSAIQASMADIAASTAAHQTKDQKHVNVASILGEIVAREAELANEAEDFRDYEAQSFGNIQAKAAENGIDISEIEAKRNALLKDRDAAIVAGDSLGSYKSDVGLGQTNIDGLDAVGATEAEKAKAQEQYDKVYARYMEQAELEAKRKAQAMGLSGDEATTYIQTGRENADVALGAKENDISPQVGITAVAALERSTLIIERSAHITQSNAGAVQEVVGALDEKARDDLKDQSGGFDFMEADFLGNKTPCSTTQEAAPSKSEERC